MDTHPGIVNVIVEINELPPDKVYDRDILQTVAVQDACHLEKRPSVPYYVSGKDQHNLGACLGI